MNQGRCPKCNHVVEPVRSLWCWVCPWCGEQLKVPEPVDEDDSEEETEVF